MARVEVALHRIERKGRFIFYYKVNESIIYIHERKCREEAAECQVLHLHQLPRASPAAPPPLPPLPQGLGTQGEPAATIATASCRLNWMGAQGNSSPAFCRCHFYVIRRRTHPP